jgi:hypothetical protein
MQDAMNAMNAMTAATAATAATATTASAATMYGAMNGSKLVWGLAAITVSLGSRFIVTDLTPMQERILRHPAVKRVVLVFMFFLPTRDLMLSVCLAFVAAMCLECLLNEKSSLCLMGRCEVPELHQHPHQLHGAAGALAQSIPVAHRAPVMGMGVGMGTLYPGI